MFYKMNLQYTIKNEASSYNQKNSYSLMPQKILFKLHKEVFGAAKNPETNALL